MGIFDRLKKWINYRPISQAPKNAEQKTGGDSSALLKGSEPTVIKGGTTGTKTYSPGEYKSGDSANLEKVDTSKPSSSSGGHGTSYDTGVKVITKKETPTTGRTVNAYTVSGQPKDYFKEEQTTNIRATTPVYTAPPGRAETRGEYKSTAKEIIYREDIIRAGRIGKTLSGQDNQYFYRSAGKKANEQFNRLSFKDRFRLTSVDIAYGTQKGFADINKNIREGTFSAISGGRTDFEPGFKEKITPQLETNINKIRLGGYGKTAEVVTTTLPVVVGGYQFLKGAPVTAKGIIKNPIKTGKNFFNFAGNRLVESAPFGFVERGYSPPITKNTKFVTTETSLKNGRLNFNARNPEGNIKLYYRGLTDSSGLVTTARPYTYVYKSGQFVRGYTLDTNVVSGVNVGSGKFNNINVGIVKPYSFGGASGIFTKGGGVVTPTPGGYTGGTSATVTKQTPTSLNFMSGTATPTAYKFGSAGFKYNFEPNVYGAVFGSPRITSVSPGTLSGTTGPTTTSGSGGTVLKSLQSFNTPVQTPAVQTPGIITQAGGASVLVGGSKYVTPTITKTITAPTTTITKKVLNPTKTTFNFYPMLDTKSLSGLGGSVKNKGRGTSTVLVTIPKTDQKTSFKQIRAPAQTQIYKQANQFNRPNFLVPAFTFKGGEGGYGYGGIPPVYLGIPALAGAPGVNLGVGIPRAKASPVRYTPSYTALVLGIRGRANKKRRYTGLEFKPITKGFKFIRRFKL